MCVFLLYVGVCLCVFCNVCDCVHVCFLKFDCVYVCVFNVCVFVCVVCFNVWVCVCVGCVMCGYVYVWVL